MFKVFSAQSEPIQLLLLVAFNAVTFAATYLFTRWLGRREARAPGGHPVAPYFTAITSIFALFMAFNASSIWADQAEAERSFRDSASAAKRLARMLGPDSVNAPDGVEAVHRYIDATIREEWASPNRKASPTAVKALDDLRDVLIRLSATTPSPVASYMFSLYDTIVKARTDRLWVRATHANPMTWLVILILGVLSQLAIGMVHADRPRAAFRTILLFTLAATASYWLLISSVNPFGSVEALLPTLHDNFIGQD